MTVSVVNGSMDPKEIPLGTGPPTREELLAHYPAQFTWTELKTFMNAGDLGLLKRHKALQARYNIWIKGIKQEYGSVADYMLIHRLRWGQPDTLSLLRSSLDQPAINRPGSQGRVSCNGDSQKPPLNTTPEASTNDSKLPVIPADCPSYFTANTPPGLISIIQNDWPYSVPADIEHTLIWTRLPIIDFSRFPPQIASRLRQDGLWGFTGRSSPPPSPSALPLCLPSLAAWNITMDKLIRSPKGTPEEDEMVREAGREVDQFVRNRWIEDEWDTAWFVNPVRIQSIPELSHIHVFARKKEIAHIGS
ncbi:hypothetical protein PILCRDRAFT_813408 [Piloderma croceum F 1598]|uniref:Uncharacterized protein n=1 Tax=Piloderma croceum (strain F 1598) TaxID=765440 RepID=A0A0C3GCM8_PILCF|nr:hypothetical protein PILCRDRAFT_813408 [Piloderma croceum F 1598]